MSLWINGVYQAVKVAILNILTAVYNAATNSISTTDTDPQRFSAVIETAWDTSNLLAAGSPHYWPDANGATMFGFNQLSLSGLIGDPDGQIDLEVQVTNDEDGATANWQSIYGYDPFTDTNVNIFTTAADLNFGWSFQNLNFHLFRIVINVTTDTNTEIVKIRRQYA